MSSAISSIPASVAGDKLHDCDEIRRPSPNRTAQAEPNGRAAALKVRRGQNEASTRDALIRIDVAFRRLIVLPAICELLPNAAVDPPARCVDHVVVVLAPEAHAEQARQLNSDELLVPIDVLLDLFEDLRVLVDVDSGSLVLDYAIHHQLTARLACGAAP